MYKEIAKIIISTGDRSKIDNLKKILFVSINAWIIAEAYGKPSKEITAIKKEIKQAMRLLDKYYKENPEPGYAIGGIIKKQKNNDNNTNGSRL